MHGICPLPSSTRQGACLGGLELRVNTRASWGISFHHLFTAEQHLMFSSLAQAFSTEGDGFALRGGEIPWDPTDRRPHLKEAQAEELLGKVMLAYRSQVGRDPLRVVVHKTSEFTHRERQGMTRALDDVPAVEMQTVRSTDFRLLRQGAYPPHRGTLAIFGDTSYLFTSGYSDARETYDGPHVPVPLELVHAGGTAAELSARELLSLSKMEPEFRARPHRIPDQPRVYPSGWPCDGGDLPRRRSASLDRFHM